jgi:hypothetical protein
MSTRRPTASRSLGGAGPRRGLRRVCLQPPCRHAASRIASRGGTSRGRLGVRLEGLRCSAIRPSGSQTPCSHALGSWLYQRVCRLIPYQAGWGSPRCACGTVRCRAEKRARPQLTKGRACRRSSRHAVRAARSVITNRSAMPWSGPRPVAQGSRTRAASAPRADRRLAASREESKR